MGTGIRGWGSPLKDFLSVILSPSGIQEGEDDAVED